MRKTKYVLFLLVLIIIIVGVYMLQSGEPTKPVKKTSQKQTTNVSVSTDFKTNTFLSDVEPEILKELKLCDSTINWSEDLLKPACTPNFFRVFPLKKDFNISNGCMVLLKAGVNGFPVRRLVVYEKEGQEIVQANGFVGYPIEFRPRPDHYDDVVIRFFERYEGQKYFYNCLFSWKQSRYQYVCCEQINDANIKPEKQAKVSAEILKILNEKQLVF